MAHEVLMPKLSSTMEEGTILQWFKEEGDPVEIGEAIFEVMTDKIAIEVESYDEGILLKRYYQIDESAPVNSVVAYIGEAGEEVPETVVIASTAEQENKEETVEEALVLQAPSNQSLMNQNEKPRATPAARRRAKEKGISLVQVLGTGRNGRIHLSDVDAYQAPKTVIKTTVNQETVIPWRGVRKIIAEQMVESKLTAPHVTLHTSVDFTKVIALRKTLLPIIEEKIGQRLSYTEIIMKATALALAEHPALNAHALEDGIHQYQAVHIGLAVSVPEGLIVPVIRDVLDKNLTELTAEAKETAGRARNGQLTGHDLTGGTFTISSLGKQNVTSFTPIIHTPEVAILGVGSLHDVVVFNEEKFVSQPTIDLSLSVDHRAVDGTPAAAFLTTLVQLLEEPYCWLV